jgi:hypothetical protein
MARFGLMMIIECVARVVLVSHGRVTGDKDEYDKVLGQAHAPRAAGRVQWAGVG